jgi:alkylated DNA nucleotide flippase Atl1
MVDRDRAAALLDRVRTVPEGFVTTYGDLSP